MRVSHYADQQLIALLILVSWCFWTPCLVDLACPTIDSHSLSFDLFPILSSLFSQPITSHLVRVVLPPRPSRLRNTHLSICVTPLAFSRHLYGSPYRSPAIGSGNPSNRVEFKLSHPRSRQVKRTELRPLYFSAPPHLPSKPSSHTLFQYRLPGENERTMSEFTETGLWFC